MKVAICTFLLPDSSEQGYAIKNITSNYQYYMPDDAVKISETEHELDVEIPSEQHLRQMAINTLTEKAEKVMQDAYVKKAMYEERIKALTMLEHKPVDLDFNVVKGD